MNESAQPISSSAPGKASRAQAKLPLKSRLIQACDRAVACLAGRQQQDHWPSDYGGPLFLLPGLVITYHITGTPWSDRQRARMQTYLRNTQNADGGWGLHVAGESTVLGTSLNYVAARLLGMDADCDTCARGRACLQRLGGAEGIPTWGKFWLATLGVYRWEGLNPLLPELWLLPRQVSAHPANMWCHTRAVFLPMTFIYGNRYTAKEDELIRALREEVFVTPWDQIQWPSQRDNIAPGDCYTPHSRWLKLFNRTLAQYERFRFKPLRQKALRWTSELIHHEDESTSYLTIGPVSKAIHMLACWYEDPDSEAFRRHVERVDDYLWDGHDGLKMQGYNGSQFWDVAFAMLAMLEHRDTSEDREVLDATLQRAHRFTDANQVRVNVDRHQRYFRDATAGSWPFSTAEQAWPVSDCTAEGIKVALAMQPLADEPISADRIEQAVGILLDSQNADGGWSEYEKARGSRILEKLNAAEVFGDIMIGYSYVECTSACIQGLRAFSRAYPSVRTQQVDAAIKRGATFIRGKQRNDGGFYGGWGVCFTYGTWFAIEGLLASGATKDDPAIRRAVSFLLQYQKQDGSWGESFRSCVEHRYVQHSEGQVVQTAWALLGLLAARRGPEDADQAPLIERGLSFLMAAQRADGGWNREAISGVFNRNCSINYDNYRFIFPLWAMARAAR